MRSFLMFLAFLFVVFTTRSQTSRADSLAGFNAVPFVLDAHLRNFNDADVKLYIKQKESEFLIKKFNIQQPITNFTAKIGSGNSISNLPCLNEDFEGLPTGPLSAPGWTAYSGTNTSPSAVCGGAFYSANSSNAVVAATPITDALVGNVPSSPFGGSNVLELNKSFGGLSTKIRQTFPVTSSNFIYAYAYKGYSSGTVAHTCCDSPGFLFNFYNCTGVLISGMSKTIIPNTSSGGCGPTPGWVYAPFDASTPNWVVTTENLAPYIGTCITVEVIVARCVAGSHVGYGYFDAKCADGGLMINQNVITAPSYTSCAATATLSGLPGFTSFLWQGPTASGVSNSTNSVVTTGTPGNYTLTATLGTVVVTQTVNLVVNTLASASITASSNSICVTNSTSLQVGGGSLTSYTWSTGSNSQSLIVTPATTTVYAVSATNSLGCISSDSKTISVSQLPSVSINASTLAACQGQSVNLSLASPGAVSYTWSTGAMTSSLSVSPSVTTVFTAAVTSSAGCMGAASQTIVILSLPQVAVGSGTICKGQTGVLTASITGTGSYLWNNGATTQSISVSPSLTAVYSVTVTALSGCTNSAVGTLTVYSLPQIQIVAPNATVCSGQVVTLIVTGNNMSSYLWSTGATTQSLSASPTINTVFSVSVTSADGCVSPGSQSVTVNPLPQVQVTASDLIICEGQSVNLSATGTTVSTYSWNNGMTTLSITVSPTLTTPYTVTVTDSNGCVASAVKTVQVVSCTGILSLTKVGESTISIFPNPTSDSFTIRASKKESGVIVSELGQIIREFELRENNNFSQSFSGFASGIYFVKTQTYAVKVIVK